MWGGSWIQIICVILSAIENWLEKCLVHLIVYIFKASS